MRRRRRRQRTMAGRRRRRRHGGAAGAGGVAKDRRRRSRGWNRRRARCRGHDRCRRRRRHSHPPEHVAALQVHRDVHPERARRLDPQARGIFALEPTDRRDGRRGIARLVQAVGQPVERFVARLVLRVGNDGPQLRDRTRPLLVGNVVLRAPQSCGIRRRRRSSARLECEGYEQSTNAPPPTLEQHG